MSFLEVLQTILPLFLYISGLVLLVILIILSIRLMRVMDRIDSIVEEVDEKVKILNRAFNVIDFFTDKISSITDAIVDRITNWVIGIGKKKYNKKEEEE